MKRDTIGEYARRTFRRLSGLLSTHARVSARETMLITAIESMRRRKANDSGQERCRGMNLMANQHLTRVRALYRWEDEGGSTATPAEAVLCHGNMGCGGAL
jgi:hypothetical protein